MSVKSGLSSGCAMFLRVVSVKPAIECALPPSWSTRRRVAMYGQTSSMVPPKTCLNSKQFRKGRLGAYPVCVVPSGDQHFSSSIEAHTKPLEHVRSGGGRERLELSAVYFDLFVQEQPPPR